MHKVGNVGINVNFVFTCICSFLLYLHNMMLVNMKLGTSGYTRIAFQSWKFHKST